MNFNDKDLSLIINGVKDLTKDAKKFLEKKITATSKEHNPSTNVDVEINTFLTRNLTSILDIPVLTEEGKSPHKLLDKELVWVVDPLDGTLNALTKSTPSCISVSLVSMSSFQVLLSCNYIIHRDEMYSAIKGRGAYINDQKIVRETFPKKIISYGLPGDCASNSEFHATHLQQVIKNGLILRQSGSAVYDILNTASGKYHGFYEFGLFLWDFIGSDLIANECGCKSFYRKTLKNNPHDLRYDYIVAGSDEELQELIKILDI